MLEALRKELYQHIEMFGVLDPRTVSKSQQLDLFIVKEAKKSVQAKRYSMKGGSSL